jgi:hypothetical protein
MYPQQNRIPSPILRWRIPQLQCRQLSYLMLAYLILLYPFDLRFVNFVIFGLWEGWKFLFWFVANCKSVHFSWLRPEMNLRSKMVQYYDIWHSAHFTSHSGCEAGRNNDTVEAHTHRWNKGNTIQKCVISTHCKGDSGSIYTTQGRGGSSQGLPNLLEVKSN